MKIRNLSSPYFPLPSLPLPEGEKERLILEKLSRLFSYLNRSGCAWELLPHDFPRAKTVYSYFRKWQKLGVWSEINQVFRQKVRCSAERNETASAEIIDSQSVKTTDVGGTQRGFEGGKKVNGRQRHIVVDTLGLLLVVVVHAANLADVTAARMVLAQMSLTQPSVEHIWPDQGYRGERLRQVALGCQLTLEIVKRHSQFEVLPRRWVVERTFAWLGKPRRLSKDYERLPEVSEAVVQVAMIPLLLNRLSA